VWWLLVAVVGITIDRLGMKWQRFRGRLCLLREVVLRLWGLWVQLRVWMPGVVGLGVQVGFMEECFLLWSWKGQNRWRRREDGREGKEWWSVWRFGGGTRSRKGSTGGEIWDSGKERMDLERWRWNFFLFAFFVDFCFYFLWWVFTDVSQWTVFQELVMFFDVISFDF
jgi:hypothetical protein